MRLVLLFGLLMISVNSFSGSAENGYKLSGVCVACHGMRDKHDVLQWPHLAGKDYEYLLASMNDFRSYARYHPLMSQVATNLTDEEMADLAAYFSSLKKNPVELMY